MTARALLGRTAHVEAPFVDTIAMQVRTSASVPFASFMTGAEPTVETVAMQVRTSASVPFADYMKAQDKIEAPSVEAVNMQVRTSASVPFADYMLSDKAAKPVKPAPAKK